MNTIDIPLGQIIVSADRYRKVEDTIKTKDGKKKMDELVESIKEHGLLNAVTVQPEGDKFRLIAGGHRLFAFRTLKRATIPATTREGLSQFQARALELEENIRRFDLTPAERVKAVADLHKLRSDADPTWTQERTAALIGSRRRADVSEATNLATLVEMFPQLKSAKSVNQLRSWAEAKVAHALRVDKVQKDSAKDSRVATVEERIWLGDSVERIKEVPDFSFRAVVTDPPFGVDYHNKVQGTIGEMTEYSDTVEDYERLLSMAPDLYRVIKPDGFLVWFFGMSWYSRVVSTFEDAGFIVDPIPIVWDRSEGKCWTRRPDRYFSRAYDVALMCIKGEPNVVKRNLPNVIKAKPLSTSERDAVVERPIELYAQIIDRLTIPGERVADFFCGAGGVPAACAQLKRDFFAIERNPERRALAINKVLAHLPK